MKKKRVFAAGVVWLTMFVVWTLLITSIDVQPLGQKGTSIGFSTWNCWFHKMTGVHRMLYTITDWLGLIPVFVCMLFGGIGFVQLLKGKVDLDIVLLGIYYVVVIAAYLIFEMIPINYRPILIEGRLEASYPSSTTLLVLCVMPTLIEQMNRRLKSEALKRLIQCFTIGFSVFMVLGRLISGVHWVTDIIGGVLLSAGLYGLYQGSIIFWCEKRNQVEVF